MRQRVCVNERDRNNVCKIEIEIMYLDEKETLRMSSHQWDKEYVWIRETEIICVGDTEIIYLDEKETLRMSNHQWDKEYVWMRETGIMCVRER